ncbi:17400_t:CDS:2 [Funneliformis caledonium]|uniref:17400_t:CDS:1 n=2 Tax=Funneliformis TaxID=1117308 RepID=A0A9N9A3Q5_9GLOM|nr:3831_t:CDS:2 [Funneliformis mosseae]CAG8515733.1 17400_t:CDS:2 [Funneliformis caledonium]
MDKTNEYQYTTVSSDISSGRQRLVFILHGSSNNNNHVQNSSSGVNTENVHSQEVTDHHLSSVSATKITVRKTVSTDNNVIIKKQETISGSHTKLIRSYIHRVNEEEDYSDDGYNSQEFDLELLKLVKKNLRVFVEDSSTRKLRNGECKWSELRPQVRNFYFPKFKKYLLDREIHAPNAMIFKCIRDLHISRRDAWLKNIRRSRE